MEGATVLLPPFEKPFLEVKQDMKEDGL